MKNKKQSSNEIAKLAAGVLRDSRSSQIAKSLAGSVVSQTHTKKQTGAELEDRASRVLRSSKFSDETKSLAGSVLSQANKKR